MKIKEYYKDKVVLITGSSMGIGKEIARQVLSHRGKVILTGRDIQKLSVTEKELAVSNDQILVYAGDVADYNSNFLMMQRIIEKFGRLDILITNAGLSCFGEVENMLPSVARQVIDTNIYGSLFPAMVALPELKKANGTIMFISSVAAFHGMPGYSVYSLSKMSLLGLAQSLAAELKDSGGTVCISFVGFTENEEQKRTFSPNGDLLKVPPRSKYFVSTRQDTATTILHQIQKKQFRRTHATTGIFLNYMVRFFPELTRRLIKGNYKKRAY